METQILPTVQKDYRLGPLVAGKKPWPLYGSWPRNKDRAWVCQAIRALMHLSPAKRRGVGLIANLEEHK